MKRFLFAISAAVLLLVPTIFSGCSASTGNSNSNSSRGSTASAAYTGEAYDLNAAVAPGADGGSGTMSGDPEQMVMPEAPSAGAASGIAEAVSASERKIIKNAYYYIETTSYEDDFANLNAKITEFSGYMQSSNSSGNVENENARSSLTIRIPADKYDAFKAVISSDFHITSSGENGDDVTSQYIDTETRLKVLATQEKRVLELLDAAKTIEDIIAIEDKLTQIRTEIESLTTTIKQLQELTSYATVNIEMAQTSSLTPIKGGGFFDDVLQGLKNTANSLVGIAIWLISIIPYLVILFLIYLLVRRLIKKHKQNKKAIPTPPETTQTPTTPPTTPEPPKSPRQP